MPFYVHARNSLYALIAKANFGTSVAWPNQNLALFEAYDICFIFVLRQAWNTTRLVFLCWSLQGDISDLDINYLIMSILPNHITIILL